MTAFAVPIHHASLVASTRRRIDEHGSYVSPSSFEIPASLELVLEPTRCKFHFRYSGMDEPLDPLTQVTETISARRTANSKRIVTLVLSGDPAAWLQDPTHVDLSVLGQPQGNASRREQNTALLNRSIVEAIIHTMPKDLRLKLLNSTRSASGSSQGASAFVVHADPDESPS